MRESPLQRPFLYLLVMALSFGWLASVSLRESAHKRSAAARVAKAKAILERPGLMDAALLSLLAGAFDFESLELLATDGSSLLSAAKPSKATGFEKLMLKAGVFRQALLEAELATERAGTLRARWTNRAPLGHFAWLLAFLGLGALALRLEAAQRLRDAEARSQADLERGGRMRAEDELRQWRRFEDDLAQVAASLGGSEARLMEGPMQEALALLGARTGSDRAMLFLFNPSGKLMDFAAGWKAEGIKDTAFEQFKNLPSDSFPWWSREIRAGRLIHAPDLAGLPEEAQNEKYVLGLHHVTSVMAAPVSCAGELLGFAALCRVRAVQGWGEDHATLLRLAGGLLGGALRRSRQREELSLLLERERILSSFSAAFLGLEGKALDAGVEESLGLLAHHLGADRGSLMQAHGDGERISVTHEWAGRHPALKASSQNLALAGLPGLASRLAAGKPWALADLEAPPAEESGAGEREEWRRRATRGFLFWPLTYKGVALGGLYFESLGRAGEWSPARMESARLAAEWLANHLARSRSEEALRRSESRHRGLLKSVPDLMLRLDPAGLIQDLRLPEGAAEAPPSVLGQPLESLEGALPPFASADLAARIREAAKAGRKAHFDYECGGGRWWEARVSPSQGSTLVLIRDIHQKKLQELDHERLLANLLAIFNAGSQGILLVSRRGRVEAFNQHAAAICRGMSGRDPHTGQAVEELIAPGQSAAFSEAFARALSGEEVRTEREVAAPGGSLWLRAEYLPVFNEDGSVRSVCCGFESVSDLREAEKRLRESEERYALAARASNDGLWDWNILTGKMFFSARFCEMCGLDASRAPSDLAAWTALMHPEDKAGFRARLEAHLAGRSSHFESEYRVLHRGTGDWCWMLCKGLAVFEGGAAVRVAGSQTDIDLRKREEGRQAFIQLSDPLTGLPNRSLVLDRVGRSLARHKRKKQLRFAVLMLNVDRFKAINDGLGRERGNELLVAVARRLERLLRPGDTVGRLGADEYVVLLDELRSSRDALAIAERIHEELAPAFDIRGRQVFASVSLGIAMSDSRYDNPEELLRDAETAMGRAKAQGPSKHIIFDPDMHAQAEARLELETDLRRAVEGGDFELHYQPIVRLADRSLYGFEGLMRWTHPRRGLVPAADFIPLAEETGQILALGRLALRQAVAQLSLLQSQGRALPLMNVNLSPEQVKDGGLVEEVREALEASQVPAGSLQLEITEGMLMDNPAAAAAVFKRLRGLGVSLAIDDFGTGYSSLSYLHQFPVDTLKIDRSFVARMDGLKENEAIVAAVITMGRSLGLKVVAEGVETALQWKRLAELGCELGQGFHFGRPLPAAEAMKGLP